MKYTREQLVLAMQKFNKNYLADVEAGEPIDESIEYAESQVDYLISLIE